jgi:trans-2,3-dihydro-3-hydroxyanthranilate isomerase
LSSYRYRVVDVFTSVPLAGNALAVFPDARGLTTAVMQKIAREFNLSETTFVFPATRADCVAKVRIFTPSREMPFAGHPTVGTSWVLVDEGAVPSSCLAFALEELVGRVPVRVEANAQPLIWLTTPPINRGATCSRKRCAEMLGLSCADLLDIEPQHLSAGNPTLYIALKDAAAVDRVQLDTAILRSLAGYAGEPFCVFAFAPTTAGAYSRMFAPEYGVTEDPATGSSTGPLAAYMMQHALCATASGTRFVSEQGTKLGRRSLLHVLVSSAAGAPTIEVGGHVVPFAAGDMSF